ncbi:hypothetical protein F5B22DRAFT_587986 [Xylaria bambusicola]|uniref:uncharacterized protein n=1 Tax=Xylaria bambusicola TaxID=326684 RepID=UPI002008B6A0|nr:uncharacterized protein F5B22DRAFT_587986 [Xylaria bambusicola]KAI0525849.1 hypothetical protein F5B22DRAFT_587986 [Xylaria bambusicola]
MRHRILRQRARTNHNVPQARHIRMQSTISQKLSIIASPKATQKQVLSKLEEHVLQTAKYHDSGMNGIAILASKEFTSWTGDNHFMSAFLQTLSPSRSTVTTESLHVLSGIMDGLGPHRLSGELLSGFSILNGPVLKILPSLYHSGVGSDPDQSSCVSFLTQPLKANAGNLEVTMPLANTIFQNGRRTTFSATRWDINKDGSMVSMESVPKTAQDIITTNGPAKSTLATIPLLPLTPPRKIVAGLGNIVRQLEVDGSTTPASKELEAILPKISEERSHGQSGLPSPLGVWCWVIPPHVTGAKSFIDLQLFKAGSSQTEADIVMSSNGLFSELLSSGCRLHKILSGGGGWGLKQGLLSLDPETSFPVPGRDDDMEMFIRSFEQRNSAEANTGLASPGWSLLFCVEPQVTSAEVLSSQWLAPAKGWHFGVASHLDNTPSPSSQSGPVEIIDDHFGISSATGLYLKGHPGEEAVGKLGFTTKIDVPGSCFRC